MYRIPLCFDVLCFVLRTSFRLVSDLAPSFLNVEQLDDIFFSGIASYILRANGHSIKDGTDIEI